MKSNRAIVEKLLRATADVDVETALALCTPDIVYDVVDLDVYRGHEGLRGFLIDQAHIAAVHRELGTIISAGNIVAAERVDTLVFAVGPVTVPTAAFFTLRDGLVCRWSDYQDLRETARTLGH